MNSANESTLHGRQKLFQRSKERALLCLNDEEYTRSFAHLIVALTIDPDTEDELLNVFLYVLGKLSAEYEEQENWTELMMCYQQATDVLPHNSQVLHGLATVLFRLGHLESAISYFKRAYKENPFFTPSLYCMENIKNSLVERWHFTMLNDEGRNDAFQKAIARAMKDGCKTVLDIGSGTGIFSMMAVDSGAQKVYACEGNDVMAQIFRKAMKANKKCITLIEKSSHDLKIPEDIGERVSLVVTETFDAALFGEHVLHTLQHAWQHLIQPASVGDQVGLECLSLYEKNKTNSELNCSEGGRVIPCSADLWVVPIECAWIRKNICVNKECLEVLELSYVCLESVIGSEDPYTTERLSCIPGGYRCLSEPKSILHTNLNNIEDITSLLSGKTITSEFDCCETGQVDAIAVWFDLHLDSEVSISTSPTNETSCWEQAIFYATPNHFQGTSQIISTGKKMTVSFLCMGHLSLQSVITDTPIVTSTTAKSLSIDVAIVHQMNSLYASKLLSTNLLSQYEAEKPTVIDTSTVPILGVKALQDGAEKLIINPSKYLRCVRELAILMDIPHSKMRVMSYEEICASSVTCHIVIAEPVEPCGLLKKNIFEDIALLRTLNSSCPPLVFPQSIGIYAKVIESSDLVKQSRLISDDSCAGYKISKYLNVYQCNVHQDIQLSTLRHDSLSDAKKLCDIDLNSLKLEKNKLQSFVDLRGTTKVEIKKTGAISAIPYWFGLSYNDGLVVNTLSEESLFKQAATIRERPLNVVKGDFVHVSWACRNSCLHITVTKA